MTTEKQAIDAMGNDLCLQRERLYAEINAMPWGSGQTPRYRDLIRNLKGIAESLDRLYR